METDQAEKSFLYFIIQVEYITGLHSFSPWFRRETRDTSWKTVELYVPHFTQEIRLIGTIGVAGSLAKSYMALDDISFTLGKCVKPG